MEDLRRDGLNASEISRSLGVPRSTVRQWLADGMPPSMKERKAGGHQLGGSCSEPFPWLTEHAYAYLLGIYLGDGHLVRMRREVFALRVFLDAIYPLIIEETVAAMALINPSGKASAYAVPGVRMKIVAGYSKAWPALLPQHGAGPKHLRPIVLAAWQREICDRFPDRLVRGLIHSDGCRSLNVIRHPKRTYSYPRYEFSNRSEDIRGIFCEYCDRLGVEWRQMNRWSISVARRDSVAELDRLVGPKR